MVLGERPKEGCEVAAASVGLAGSVRGVVPA